MKRLLAGKKIWLIGASEGIGRALAQKLADEGAQLALSARQADKLEQLAQKLSALSLPADVCSDTDLRKAFAAIAGAWGHPDMVIYNAGAYEPMAAQNFILEKVQAMMDVNFHGALRMLDCVLGPFLGANKGHIVFVGSIAAYRGLPGAIGYGASKAALLNLAEGMAIDLLDSNIKIQVMSPGFVKTRLTDKNNFDMPGLISPAEAADYIVRGLKAQAFEIRFPFFFPLLLRVMSYLPFSFFARLMQNKPDQAQ